MHIPSLVPLSLLFHVYSVFAVKFAFQARHTVNRLQRRAGISGQPIANTHNAEYMSNITLGGRSISVMLDTGRYVLCSVLLYLVSYILCWAHSSDLWVTGSVPGSTDTGKSATLSYAVGQAAGW